MLDSYLKDERARISQRYLPSREAIVEILESVLDLMYPGYFGRQDLNRDNLSAHVSQMVAVLRQSWSVNWSIACATAVKGTETRRRAAPEFGEAPAHGTGADFSAPLPQIRDLLIRDVQAAFDGDPAALNLMKSSWPIPEYWRSACTASRTRYTTWGCR